MVEDEDDAIHLDPAYLLQAAGDYAGNVGDQLQFTGFDLGSARRSGGADILDDGASVADYEEQWEMERQRYSTQLRMMKERDKTLVRSANDKMRRAREKGKSRASLTPDEIDALERRRLQENQNSSRSSSSAKDRRSSSGKDSRSSSSNNLAVEKTRDKSGSRFFSSPAANSSRTRVPREPPKSSRRVSLDTSPSAHAAPGFLVLGPDGQPMYSSVPAYASPSAYSRSDLRSASASSVLHAPQAYEGGYIPYSPRYHTPQDHRTTPPAAASSRRSGPDELNLPRTRERASSTVHYHPRTPSGSHGRRNVSGPAGMGYERPRQTATSPLAEHSIQADSLDARMEEFEVRHEDEGGRSSDDDVVVVHKEDDEETDGDDEGVRVQLQGKNGYRIDRVPVGGRRDRDKDRDRDREKDRRRKKR